MMTLCPHSSSHMNSDLTKKSISWKSLEEVVLFWIERVTARKPYVWQQNFASCHTSRRTQSWLIENFCDHIILNMWPPNSLDCNPLDYYVWDAVERETNKTPCNTKDELTARIITTLINLNQDTVGKACNRFRSHLKAVVEANGDFFELIQFIVFQDIFI